MTPLPPNNTARYFLDYQTGIYEHTMMVRANASLSPASMGTSLNSLLTALAPLLFATTFTRLRFAASGSNVSNPVTSGFEGATYGSAAPTVDDYPKFFDFVGRSGGGRRWRMAIITSKTAISGYRLTTAESTAVAAAIPIINGLANGYLAIDDTKPVVYPYVDVGYNAYWQRNVRT